MRAFKQTVLLLATGLASLSVGAPIASPATAVLSQYIIQLKPDIDITKHLSWINDIHARSPVGRSPLSGVPKNFQIGSFKAYTGQFDDETVSLVKASGDVLLVEKDQQFYTAELHQSSALTARQIGQQPNPPWNLRQISQRPPASQPYYFYDTTGQNAFAYILDTGIDTSLREFEGRASNGYNSVGGSFTDGNGHGTHVAGIVGSITYGVAKKCNIVSVKVFGDNGSGTTRSIIDGLTWAVDNIKATARQNRAVINMAIGGAYSQALNNAVKSAYDSGILVVVAAGGSNTDVSSSSPASLPEAFTVGASDINYQRASSSNYGSGLDIFAPGVNILSTWPGGTNTISGTSMSCAHAAGVVLMFQERSGYKSGPKVIGDAIIAASTKNALSGVPSGTPNRLLYNGSGR